MVGGGYSNSGTTGTSNTTSTGTTSSTPTFSSGTQALPGTMASYLMQLFQNPSMATAPAQNIARNQTVSDYAGADAANRKAFLSTGGGMSGKYGQATVATNVGRAGSLANVDNQFANTNATMPLTAAGLATSLLGTTKGVSTTGTGTSAGATSSGSSGYNSTVTI